ncbi:AsmA family protein [Photobacterium sp. SDRW27]|uniref:AsmA family protein n=1 Tax=Photobacterium obscurum TaxID=2829490 RepID=UPI002243F9F5|nr:AsmA family protein [Photobacterium obscurum]MCW8331071.1 AsmA family protein [Photobacterium obscurum]
MRLAGKLIATLLVLLALSLTILITLLHTQYATSILTHVVDRFSPYSLSTPHISYSITEPWRLTLEQPHISLEQQTLLKAEQLEVWLTPTKLLQPGWHFDTILVDGLSLSPATPLPTLPAVSTNRLALTRFTLLSPELDLRNSQLQFDNWRSQPASWGEFSGDFQLAAEQARWQQATLNNVLLDGDHYAQHWKLYGFSFNWQHANFNGQAEYLNAPATAKALRLHQLTLSGLQLQDASLFNLLQERFSQLTQPAVNIDIRRLDILDSSIELPDYSINNASLSLQNWTWPSDHWQQQQAHLSLNADNVRWQETVFDEPLVEIDFSPQQITIEGASAKVLEGYVQADGAFTPDMLALNQLTINGIKWFIPEQWPAQLQAASRYFNDISLTKLDISYAQLTDSHPERPFQLSGINASGQDLVLKRRGRIGLWQGELTASAGFASVNSITMVEPFVAMQSQAGQWQLSQLIIPFRNGLLEAEGAIALNRDGQPWQVEVAADSIPTPVLRQWLQLPLPVSGVMDIALSAQGLAQHSTNLAYSLEGELTAGFRQLQLDKITTTQLWQQWSQESGLSLATEHTGHHSGSHSPITASPLHISADRGRITIQPISLSGDDFSATLQGLWDLARPDRQTIQLKARQGCQQLNRYWSGNQQQISLSSCDGSSI